MIYSGCPVRYNQDMILRAAKPEDIAGIMNVELNAFIPAIQENEAVFKERIRVCTNCFIVFEDEISGHTAGYFSAERWNKIPDSDSIFVLGHSAAKSQCRTGPVLYLTSFALLDMYRGSGLGRKLFAQSIDWFTAHNTGIQKLVLLVNSEWKGAEHIYREYGFTELRRIPEFFPVLSGRNTDGIIMTASIPDLGKRQNRTVQR
jgi:ribosomal protein S18 acetylase RimI-like enzyme